MTALAGQAGVDRPFRPEDITGRLLVTYRGAFVEVAQAPDVVTLPLSEVFQLLRNGVAVLRIVAGTHYLLVGYQYPVSTNGRVLYRLHADPRRAVALGGYTATIEGTRVA